MEDRLAEGEMEAILGHVSESLNDPVHGAGASGEVEIIGAAQEHNGEQSAESYEETWDEQDGDNFDDTGEGAGVEGDLEMDED